ncbi:MAG: helix-hairpin-helix domain-containing protein [Bacteroidetes bacterium]|nr:helix-hairpin-helix domain-containing protein [Bacteroidota bacterium]
MARYTSKRKELPKNKINIAIALKAELMRLPGVGEKMAEKILEHRKITPFTSTQDLMNVKGIGKKKFEKIEPYIIFEKKK